MAGVKYRTADVDGLNIFYREVQAAHAPNLLLLHGFPTASHMFRDLIPLLADGFHIIAPDLPGFGRSGIGSSFAGSSETEAVSSCDGAVRQRFSSAQPRLNNIRADRGQKRRGCALCPHRLRFLKS